MTPPDLAALAREVMLEMMPLIGADRPWGYPVERLITRKLETVDTLSRTAGRAQGLEAAIKALRVLASEESP